MNRQISTSHARLNRSQDSRMHMSSDSLMQHRSTSNRIAIIKRVVMISSIKKELKKTMIKLIENGHEWLTDDIISRVMAETKSMLDNDKQKELLDDLHSMQGGHEDFLYMMLQLVKHFVISPVEKGYITKIEREIREDEQLEADIRRAEEELNAEKKKKLEVYELRKAGKLVVSRGPTPSNKDSENYENKLMRANQKLNELSVNNNKLREKINQLRKEKNAMEDIYQKLKRQLEAKKEDVENTIKFAGEAYNARNQAEEELKNLKEKAELKKQQFRQDCEKLNNEIQHDMRFKQFIKSKQIQKDQLEKLEQQIKQNEQYIEQKKEQNMRTDLEYQKSMAKEIEIKNCFDRIKREVGIPQSTYENEGRDLLNIFTGLYEKNANMKMFVDELNEEVENLEAQIEQKRAKIAEIYQNGESSSEIRGENEKAPTEKYNQHERKSKILKMQYDKSVEILQSIKTYLEGIFEEIGVDSEVIQRLKSSTLSEDNINDFLSHLEAKALDAVSHYGSMVSEQLKADRPMTQELQEQIGELNNIITMQNNNTVSSGEAGHKLIQYPSELFKDFKEEKCMPLEFERRLYTDEIRKICAETLENFYKKQTQKQQTKKEKYNSPPALVKSKKK